MKHRYLISLLTLLSTYGYGQPEKFVLQAEDAEYGGGSRVLSSSGGFRGSGFVDFPRNGGYVNFSDIDGGEGGDATLLIRWALGNDNRTGELVVNEEAFPLTLESTGSWSQWAEKYISINLDAGANNSISLRSTGQDLGNLDEITVWNESRHSCTYDAINLDGRWVAPYWESSKFEGTVCRVVATDASMLYADVQHTLGGWDMALSYSYGPHIQVDDLPTDLEVNGKIDVDLSVGSGRWWAGPKFSVRRPGSSGLPGNYENYIIENASMSPDEVHTWRMNTEGSVYLGTTAHNGSIYKHYHNPHEEWQQYWAVRQDYRTEGTVSIKPIAQKWRSHGMRNDFIRSMRVNIEASRSSQGSVVISNVTEPLPGQQKPFGGTAHAVADGARIEAEHYDQGGPNTAYYDTDEGNRDCAGRTDRVDLQTTTDQGGGCNVGWIKAGEWLEYTVDVEEGTYDIKARLASPNDNRTLGISLDGNELGTVDCPNASSGWQDWRTATLAGVALPAGRHVIRLTMQDDGFNINYLEFEKKNTAPNLRSASVRSDYIYPNPVSDKLHLPNIENLRSVQIYGPNGQELRRATKFEDKYVSVEDMPEGIYILRLNWADHTSTNEKFLIER